MTAMNLFGVPVEAATMSEVLDKIEDTIKQRATLDIGVVNAAKIVNMHRNPDLYDAVMSSDVIYADGAAVVKASRLLGKPLPERIAGIDLMTRLYERGNELGYRIYCFGATEAVSLEVARCIKQDYPGVNLVGRRNGYYEPEQEQAIAEAIAEAKPDILFVAMTSPKKEQFMARWSETMAVPVVHGVGGSFDVMAGKVERAPEVWQKLGLEWLYRVKQEPRRLWKRYLVTNSLFLWMLFKELVKRPFKA